jgi:cyclic pyranopterin phosphate synthase
MTNSLPNPGNDSALKDTFGRRIHDLRISVTDRCNYRCPYCMPAEIFGERYHFLPRADVLSYEEITRLTRLFVSQGVEKVRLTGGEPLVRQDIEELVAQLSAIPGIDDLTLTTNGYLLAEHAVGLKQAGLERITVSLDSLDPEIYAQMNGRGFDPSKTQAGIAAAEQAGMTPIKINAVVERGVNEHTALDLARHFKGSGQILRFIEFMDVGNLNGWDPSRVVPSAELVALINAESPIEPVNPNYAGEVAERWRYVDGTGEIGFISSVSQPFCAGCTRARLSPEGKLFTCLFASDGHDLKTPMRAGATDEEMVALIRGIWSGRSDRYSELRAEGGVPNDGVGGRKVEMYQIGG